MHELDVSDIEDAKTGKPIKCVGYRGQHRGITDPSRGTFYSPSKEYAMGYVNPGGHLKRVLLKFTNPFVCRDTKSALAYLVKTGFMKREMFEKLADHGAYAYPPAERMIAAGMRKNSHDAIIYNGGLDEIVDLR